jgi:hypothetical protein
MLFLSFGMLVYVAHLRQRTERRTALARLTGKSSAEQLMCLISVGFSF